MAYVEAGLRTSIAYEASRHAAAGPDALEIQDHVEDERAIPGTTCRA